MPPKPSPKPTVPDKEAHSKWVNEYKFSRHVVDAVYARSTSFSINTSDYSAFNNALFASGGAQTINLDSAKCDKGRLGRNVVFEVDVTHEIHPVNHEELPKPVFTYKSLTQWFETSFLEPPAVQFIPPDGTLRVHETILLAGCDHLKDSLLGDFKENARNTAGSAKSTRGKKSSTKDKGTGDLVRPSTVVEEPFDFSRDSDYSDPEDNEQKTAGLIDDCKTIQVPNFARQTFKAFAGYLYTGTVNFNNLKSAGDAREKKNEVLVNAALPNEWAGSPKSLYRLADYYNVPELKKLCQNAFEQSLYPSNALVELSMPFARIHPSIAEAIERYLTAHWTEVATSSGFDEAVQELVQFEESRTIFLRVLKILKQVPGTSQTS